MTIWKYAPEIADTQTLMIPAGAQLLCVQTQNEEPQLWALVDAMAPKEERLIITHGTGHQAEEVLKAYLGTYQIRGGALVFHCFEGGE